MKQKFCKQCDNPIDPSASVDDVFKTAMCKHCKEPVTYYESEV
jgi:RNase P subunit RPR2